MKSKSGLSRIQFTFFWDGQRLHLGSGQKCHPKDWDAKRELLRAKTGAAGTYVDTVNQVLETYADAAHAAYHNAQLSGRPHPHRAHEQSGPQNVRHAQYRPRRATYHRDAGHRTKSSFNRYVDIDEAELVANYRKTARQVAATQVLPPAGSSLACKMSLPAVWARFLVECSETN